MDKLKTMLKKDKRGRFAFVWIFVAMFFGLVLLALIEPLKEFLEISLAGLSCATTADTFILPVCFLVRAGMILFVGTGLYFVIRWAYFKSVEK